MKGKNTIKLNKETAYDLIEKALKDYFISDKNFRVTDVRSDYTHEYEITIEGGEIEEASHE